MTTPVLTPVPARTPVTEICPAVPDFGDIAKPEVEYRNITALVAIQPSVTVITPIVMLSVGLCSNIIAVGIFNCSRSAHREHAFYGLLRGMLFTNILGYLEIYPIIILGHMKGLHWVGGPALCNFHGIAILNFGLCLAYLTGALAWERFLATCRPSTYDKKIERRKIPYIIALMWVVATFTSLLPLAGFGRFREQYPRTWCFLDWRYEETVGRLFCSILATAVAAICLFLVATLVAASGVCVYRTYHERRNKLPTTRYRVDLDGFVSNSTPHTSSTNGPLIRFSQEVTRSYDDIPHGKFRSLLCWATFQYSLVAITFFYCYIPVVIRIISNVSGRPENLWADMSAMHRAEYYPICLPMIYVLFHKQLWVRITLYKKRRHQLPIRHLQPLESGRSIQEIQRYRRYNQSNHLGGSWSSNHVNRSPPKTESNHVNRVNSISSNDGTPNARKKLTFPGRLLQAEAMYLPEENILVSRGMKINAPSSASSQTQDTGNCLADTSLDSLLMPHEPSQTSRSLRSIHSGRCGSNHSEEFDITVLEKLMDSAEKSNNKKGLNIKSPRRLESAI